MIGADGGQASVHREDGEEEEEGLLIERPVTGFPGKLVREAEAGTGAGAEAAGADVLVVIEAAAPGDVETGADVLRRLQVGASLARVVGLANGEAVDVAFGGEGAVVTEGLRGIVVDAEHLVAAAELDLIDHGDIGREVVLDGGFAFAVLFPVDDGGFGDQLIGVRAHGAEADEVLDLLVDGGFGVGDSEEADGTVADEALPVEAGGGAPAVVADVEGGDFAVGFFVVRWAEADVVEAGEVDGPDSVLGREVVEDFGVEAVVDWDAAEADVFGEEVEEAAAGGDDPGAFFLLDGAFEDGAGAGEAEGGAAGEFLAITFALGNLEDAGEAVDVGAGLAAGEEVDVADELGIEDGDGAAGGGEVGEVVDVGDFDVVDDEEVFERAAAADDDVVPEVVGADGDAGERLDIAGDVLEGAGGFADFAGLDEVVGILDFFRCDEDRFGDGDRLGEEDIDSAFETGADFDGGGEAAADIEDVGAGAQFGEAEVAFGVGSGAFLCVLDADANVGCADGAADGAYAGGVLTKQ